MELSKMVFMLSFLNPIQGQTTRSYEYTSNAYDKICDNGSTFKHENVTSQIQCMAVCTQDPVCRGASFAPKTRTCRRCLNTVDLISETGARHFKLVQDCLENPNNGGHIHAAYEVLESDSGICLKDVLKVTNGISDGGDWKRPEFCPVGSYAVGYSVKIEVPSMNNILDESGANGLALKCRYLDGTSTSWTIKSSEGPNGIWSQTVSCNEKQILEAFRLQVEHPTGPVVFYDETAVNFVTFKCGSFYTQSSLERLEVPPGIGYFGTFGEWSSNCAIGQGICGLRVKMDPYSITDYQSLKDVVVFCCR